jgi:hypothetical protein
MTDMGQSYAQANSARDQANTARSDANTTFATINTSFGTINTNATNINSNAVNAYAQANGAYDQANAAYLQANIALISANQANVIAKDAYSQANTARTTANDAYATANTKLGTSGGSISGDLTISGNLVVQGNATTINVSNLSVNDSIILLSSNSSGDAEDIGFVGHITRNSTNTHVGLIRKATENRFYLFDNYEIEPTNNVIDITGNNFRVGNIRLGIINANSFVTVAGLDVTGQANAAYGQANTARSDANTTFATVNTTFGTINTSLGTINTSYQAAYSQANTAGTNSLNAYGQANAAYSQANSAYGAANNRVLKAGDTMTGTLTMGANISFQNDETAYWIKPSFNGGAIRFRSNVGASTDRGLQFGNIDNAGGWTSYMTVDSGGSVGIGTASPSEKLTIQNGRIYANISGSDRPAIFESDTTRSTLVLRNSTANTNEVRVGSNGYNLVLIANTEGLRLTPTGNVGIGTESPSTKLHLYESGAADVLFRLTSANGTYDPLIQFTGQGNDITAEGFEIWYDNDVGDVHLSTTYPNDGATIHFHTRTGASKSTSNERLTILGNGNVGIGVTTPQRKLDVFGSGILASFGSQMGVNSIAGIHFGYSESSLNVDTYKKSAMVFERTDNHNQGGNASGKIHFLLHNASSTSASGTNSAVLTLDTDGNGTLGSARVGIGTTSPTAALHVSGTSGDSAPTFRINGTAAASTFNWAGSIMNSSLGSSRNTILLIGKLESTKDSGYFGFNHSGTNGSNTNFLTFGLYGLDNVLNITGAGNVGIGTTSPAAKLHVSQGTPTGIGSVPANVTAILDNSTNNFLLFRQTADSGSYSGIAFQDNNVGGYVIHGDGGSGDKLYLAGYGGVDIQQGAHNGIAPGSRTTIGSFTSTGLAVTGTISESSSIKIKENIDPIIGALDSIVKLNGVTYDRIDGTAKKRAGLIAEQVNDILPNIVQKDDKGNPLAIQYTNIIAYLIESIKELKAEIDALKGK